MANLDETKEITLPELWRLLCDEEDITITVDTIKVEYIRKGLAKQKHREMVKLGEFADKTLQFRSNLLPQNDEERSNGVVGIRLQLTRQEGLTIHRVQVNATNEFED